jgi:glycosyltransferase involved in cell wall biosynthesis
MKILLANTKHFPGGGDSTYTFNLARLLREKDHEVAFFAMQDPNNVPDVNSDLFVSHIDFRKLNSKKNLCNSLSALSRVIYSSEARRNFSQILDRIQPDVVHVQNIHAHITPSIIFEASQRKIPLVWTLHDYKTICPNSHFRVDATNQVCEACGKSAFFYAVLKRCKKGSLLASSMAAIEAYSHRLMRVREKVDYFLSPSVFLRNKLIDRGISHMKVKHLPLFLPDESFHHISHDEGYILFLGRLTPLKGIYPLLEACQRTPQTHLIIAGQVEEPLTSQLPKLLSPQAEYVGMTQGEKLHQLLAGARAVILPSLCYENQPFSLTEAFAAGKPVIASDLGGMTELVKNSEGGILVPPGDVDALAGAMQWITLHPKEASRMGKKAQQYAHNVHSPEIHFQKLMQIYRQAIEGKYPVTED